MVIVLSVASHPSGPGLVGSRSPTKPSPYGFAVNAKPLTARLYHETHPVVKSKSQNLLQIERR